MYIILTVLFSHKTKITYFPDTQEGDARFEYFKQVINIESVNELLAQYTGNLSHVGVALITFFYVDFLDTSGTLLGLAHAMGVVDEEGNFPKSRAPSRPMHWPPCLVPSLVSHQVSLRIHRITLQNRKL
jgi:AGZA family xanthine/uracil permease-like MFS transporter